MAGFTKFNDFVLQLAKGTHVFGTHQYKIALSNSNPGVNTLYWDVTSFPAPSAAVGYPSGGAVVNNVNASQSGGVLTVIGDEAVFTVTVGGGNQIGPFRYAILYNNTSTNKNLVASWDYGASITLNSGEVFEWKPNNAVSAGTIFTLS